MSREALRRTAALTSAFILGLGIAACGDDDDPSGSSGSEPAEEVSGDEGEVRDAVLAYLIEGECDVMTDEFVQEQTLGLAEDEGREGACELFESQHTEPLYDESGVVFSDFSVDGEEANITVGDNFTNIESVYTLVNDGESWQIASAEIGVEEEEPATEDPATEE